jgi:DNA invertase Pin-like site-specific DNA recombinase
MRGTIIGGTSSPSEKIPVLSTFVGDSDIGNSAMWKLDRLGRSLKDLITRITELNDRKIGFKSLTEQIDTTTSGGKLIFHIFGALAEFERDIIKERTNAGLEAARTRGKRGGRPKALSPERIKLAKRLYADTSTSVAEICKMLGISRHTLQRYVKE